MIGLEWSEERWVRVYTRDTAEWLSMVWQSRSLYPLLLRKVDRSGRIPLSPRIGPDRSVAGLVGMPVDVVTVGLAELLELGWVTRDGDHLVATSFRDMDEARMSDSARKRAQRERDRDDASRDVTDGPASGPDVTQRPTRSRSVTPSLAEPSRAEPSLAEPPPPTPPAEGPKRAARSRPKTSAIRADHAAIVAPALARLTELRRELVGPRCTEQTIERDGAHMLKRAAEGVTTEQLLLVVEAEAAKVRAGEDPGYFDAVTPFRDSNWSARLAKAEAWEARRSRTARPGSPPSRHTANMAEVAQRGEELRARGVLGQVVLDDPGDAPDDDPFNDAASQWHP